MTFDEASRTLGAAALKGTSVREENARLRARRALGLLRTAEGISRAEHERKLDEMVEHVARSLNDDWAAGSQGARWGDLEDDEREHWRKVAGVHLGTLRAVAE